MSKPNRSAAAAQALVCAPKGNRIARAIAGMGKVWRAYLRIAREPATEQDKTDAQTW